MANEKYAINMEAVRDTTRYFTNLRNQFYLKGDLTIRKLAGYTGIAPSTIGALEKNEIAVPRLEMFFRLAGYWELSDNQVVEIYKAFCGQNKKLKIVDKNIKMKDKNIEIIFSTLKDIPAFWYKNRKENGYTLLEVSNITGIPETSVSNIEGSDKCNSLISIIPLCKLYGVTDEEVISLYHRTIPSLRRGNSVNLDDLSKDELIDIILNYQIQTGRFYSESKEKVKTMVKK